MIIVQALDQTWQKETKQELAGITLLKLVLGLLKQYEKGDAKKEKAKSELPQAQPSNQETAHRTYPDTAQD